MVIMARVAMKGVMANLAMKRPDRAPLTSPTTRAPPMPRTIAGPGETGSLSSSAHTTPDAATMEPTDRSIPAARITKVIPAAVMARTDVCRVTLARLETDKKCSETTPKTTTSAPPRILTSVDFPAPFSPARQCTSPARSSKSTS